MTRNVDRAHSLSPDAAKVWRSCDGNTSAEELSSKLGVDPDTVARALDELSGCDLLEEPPTLAPVAEGSTRREVSIKAAKVGAAAAAAPLILSVAAPPPAMAATLEVMPCVQPRATAAKPGGSKSIGCCCCVPLPSLIPDRVTRRCAMRGRRRQTECKTCVPCPGTHAGGGNRPIRLYVLRDSTAVPTRLAAAVLGRGLLALTRSARRALRRKRIARAAHSGARRSGVRSATSSSALLRAAQGNCRRIHCGVGSSDRRSTFSALPQPPGVGHSLEVKGSPGPDACGGGSPSRARGVGGRLELLGESGAGGQRAEGPRRRPATPCTTSASSRGRAPHLRWPALDPACEVRRSPSLSSGPCCAAWMARWSARPSSPRTAAALPGSSIELRLAAGRPRRHRPVASQRSSRQCRSIQMGHPRLARPRPDLGVLDPGHVVDPEPSSASRIRARSAPSALTSGPGGGTSRSMSA